MNGARLLPGRFFSTVVECFVDATLPGQSNVRSDSILRRLWRERPLCVGVFELWLHPRVPQLYSFIAYGFCSIGEVLLADIDFKGFLSPLPGPGAQHLYFRMENQHDNGPNTEISMNWHGLAQGSMLEPSSSIVPITLAFIPSGTSDNSSGNDETPLLRFSVDPSAEHALIHTGNINHPIALEVAKSVSEIPTSLSSSKEDESKPTLEIPSLQFTHPTPDQHLLVEFLLSMLIPKALFRLNR